MFSQVSTVADALGISERTLRGMLPDLPHIREGGVVMIPVEDLREWLRARVQADRENTERLAREVLDAFDE